MARPKYGEWISESGQAQIRAWVKDGLTDSQIAKQMGISKTLLSRWRHTHIEIKRALVRLKTIDGKQVDAHDLKHGAPARKLDNVNTLQAKIDGWLKECKETNTPPTRTGLCLLLNISKDALTRYIQEVDAPSTIYQADSISGRLHPVSVSDVLKRAIMAIERDLEIRMIAGRGNVAGIIFDLKNNHGYADKSEVTTAKIPAKQSNEDIDKRIKELLDKSGADVIPFKTGTK